MHSVGAGGILLFATCWFPFPVDAESQQATRLPEVVVYGEMAVDATGSSRLGSGLIENLPANNGTVSELLQVFPDVQNSEEFSSSRTGGEILPPDLSISGGKVFQNNFSFDGFDNNSLLDPTARNPMDITDVPGHPQKFFLNADLVDEVLLYDSNIPARYGGFTGGVVDVRTRQPRDRFSGEVGYRHTNADWTSLHLSEDDRAGFSNSDSANKQPDFKKHQAGFGVDIPLAEGTGLLFDYRLLSSTIPLHHLGEEVSQHRRNQNILAKFSHEPSSTDSFDIIALYAPYEADYFIRNSASSDFEIEGGGWQLGGTWHHDWLDKGLEVRFGVTDHWNERSAPLDWKDWAATDTKDWGKNIGSLSSQEGGFGSIEKNQVDIELGAELVFFPVGDGELNQEIAVGAELVWLNGRYDRAETTGVYRDPRLTPDVICGADNTTCVDGEQFFTKRILYPAEQVNESIFGSAFYLEDRLAYRRLMVRPGLRLDYDDYLQNLNLAPRLAAEYDLFGDGDCKLVAGVNRYYGHGLLSFKLREAKKRPANEYRTTSGNLLQPWQDDPLKLYNQHRFSDLDTPYADEFVLGIDQKIGGGLFSTKWVGRRSHDEFARSYGPIEADGLRYYEMNNAGSSRHDSVRLSWERSWPNQFLLLSWNVQSSRSSHENYNAVLDNDAGEERVWYRGEIVYRSELPRRDYNRAHSAQILYTVSLPYGFSWSNVTRYLGPYDALVNSNEEQPVPSADQRIDLLTGLPIEESLAVYEDVRYGSELIFDWKITWQHIMFKRYPMSLQLDLLNVFNREVESATRPGTYRTGRQVWAGLNVAF
ncbi:MAG: hypothetical protein C0616_09800 [Desulfuromonas sp.]|nr:MAG: hypothetical protein C0616_09800 [Desulfuromonas sp.]